MSNSNTCQSSSPNFVFDLGIDDIGEYSRYEIQVADISDTSYSSPSISFTEDENFKTFAGGNAHSIAIKEDGTVWTWGQNHYGQLGNNSSTDETSAIQVLGEGGNGVLNNVVAVDATEGGFAASIALKDDGTVWTWGSNDTGLLGDGTQTDRQTPVQGVAQ